VKSTKRHKAKNLKKREKERKRLTDLYDLELKPEPATLHEKKQQTVKKDKETIQLRGNLINLLKETQANELFD
jgi:hypothetical protein